MRLRRVPAFPPQAPSSTPGCGTPGVTAALDKGPGHSTSPASSPGAAGPAPGTNPVPADVQRTPAPEGAPAPAPVQDMPARPPLGGAGREMPTRAVPPASPESRSSATSEGSPSPPSAPRTPGIQRSTAPSPRPDAPVRPPLGEPLHDLPVSAKPLNSSGTRSTVTPDSGSATPSPPLPLAQHKIITEAVGAPSPGPAPESGQAPAAVGGTAQPPRPDAPSNQTGPRPFNGIGTPLHSLPPTATAPGAPPPGRRPGPAQRTVTPGSPVSPTTSASSPERQTGHAALPVRGTAVTASVQRAQVTRGAGARASRGGEDTGGSTPSAKASATGRSVYSAALPFLQRSRALLPERSLSTNTVTSSGFSQTSPTPSPAIRLPVAAARWSREPAPVVQSAPSPLGDPPSGPSRSPQERPPQDEPPRQRKVRPSHDAPLTARPTLPAVRSSVAAGDLAFSAQGVGHSPASDTAPEVRGSRRTPVVRPAPPATTESVRRLPIATAPPTTAPSPHGARPPDAPLKAADRTTSAARAAIQRAPEDTEPRHVPPAAAARSRIPVPVKKTSASVGRSSEPPERGDGIDVEDLARRLIDPVARLLRTDVRRGRERAGRLYDGGR